MDCHRFRRDHLAYLDDTLPGDDMRRAQLHLLQCAACGAHDALVRRSLMLVRSLPDIAPRADFQQRLRVRLAEQVAAEAVASTPWMGTGESLAGARWGRRAPVTYLAVAVVGMMAGAGVWGWWARSHAPALVAAVPASVPTFPVSRPSRVAPVAASLPAVLPPGGMAGEPAASFLGWGVMPAGGGLEAVVMDDLPVPVRPAGHVLAEIR